MNRFNTDPINNIKLEEKRAILIEGILSYLEDKETDLGELVEDLSFDEMKELLIGRTSLIGIPQLVDGFTQDLACPNCGEEDINLYRQDDFCRICGAPLDWIGFVNEHGGKVNE